MNRRRKLVLGVFLQAALSVSFAGSAAALSATPATKIARVTGATPAGESLPNPNQTKANYQVWGTDLGIMWDKGGGEIFAVFGDTFGSGWVSGGGGGDWRSNVLAKSTDANLADGLTFSTMFTDTPGHAKEILSAKKLNFDEMTVIPTSGITVGSRHYIHYMSVHHWGDPGNWYTNYSGIAYSDNGGASWTKHATARWNNNSSTWDNKFQMAALVKNGGFVYMYGTPNGRFGDVYLSRAPENLVLSIGDYRYWDGNGWSASQSAAAPVATGVAGEMSVAYNTSLKRFVMLYMSEHRAAIVMRDSPTLTGPWNGEKVIAPASSYPGIYGSFIHPWTNNNTDLYFITSQWNPYNSFLMRSTLSPGDDNNSNIVSEPGFEGQEATVTMAPWHLLGNGGIDRDLNYARTGRNNGFVYSKSGWNALVQRIAVQPHTNYTLKGWMKSSANSDHGYFGAMVPNGPILDEVSFGPLANYTEHIVNFNSGANSYVEIYSGVWAQNVDTWMQLDDVSVTRDANLLGHVGFESQPTSVASSPWYVDGKGGIDRNLGFSHSGANNGYVRNTSGWNAMKQEVSVEPNTNYTLTAWIRTSANQKNGYFGARALHGGPILNETLIGTNLPNYTKKSVTFNSGSNHSIEIFAGTWASGDTWMQMDTFSLTKN